jgi:hypothetical protein
VSKSNSLDNEIAALRERVSALTSLADSAPFSPAARRKVDHELRDVIETLEAALRRLDPITMPRSVFDPSNPKVIGRFTALALVAQERVPLISVGQFYGSGVYAIYYRGAYPLYAPLSDTETPIYVGQAAPGQQGAHTARDQGPRLAARLNEHRKNIAKAMSTLDVSDFEARFLVVQSGWETAAEDYLIHLFRPIWNNETNLLYGLGKHGDSATTRANKRSPWDTLHPGRAWAAHSTEDARAPEQIVAEVTAHFDRHAPYRERAALLEDFFAELRQS